MPMHDCSRSMRKRLRRFAGPGCKGDADLRCFEKALLQELGYGLTLDTDASGVARLTPTAHYAYEIEHGPVRLQRRRAARPVGQRQDPDRPGAEDFSDPRSLQRSQATDADADRATIWAARNWKPAGFSWSCRNYDRTGRQYRPHRDDSSGTPYLRTGSGLGAPSRRISAVPTASPFTCAKIVVTFRTPMSRRLRDLTQIKLNLEMAATDEMVGIACRLKPEMAMLVPEGRHEVTTEGGLDIAGAGSQAERCRSPGWPTPASSPASSSMPNCRRSKRRHALAHASAKSTPAPMPMPSTRMGAMPKAPAVLGRTGQDPQAGERDSRTRHALQCRPCAQLLQRAAGCPTGRHPRTAHRPRHRQPRRLCRPARSRARNEASDARSGAICAKQTAQ